MVFVVIQDMEHSVTVEEHYSNYTKNKNFYLTFNSSDRKIQLDSLLCGKSYVYKSLEDTKEENQRVADIVEQAYSKYVQQQTGTDKYPASSSAVMNPETSNNPLKKGFEGDPKKMVDFEKPHCQPFNYEYYSPISGDTIG